MSTPKEKPIVITCRVSSAEMQKVRKDARRRKRTVSDHVRGKLGLEVRAS